MGDKFIYVFDATAKAKLLMAGFVLLKEDEVGSVYIFAADKSLSSVLEDVSYIATNTLSY